MGDKFDYETFTSRVAEIVEDQCAVFYCDFIESIGLIVSELSSKGYFLCWLLWKSDDS